MIGYQRDRPRSGMVQRLQTTKFIRAVGQGALLVLFSLYLKELGWSVAAVGLLFTAGGLLNAGIGWMTGLASDRIGRKIFVLFYEAATVVAALMLLFTDHSIALGFVCLFLGFGRVQSGIPGVAAAAEQAWLAEGVPRARRGTVYSKNSALGFFGMGAGAVLAGVVPFLRHVLPGLLAYRSFFALVAIGALLNWLLLRDTPEKAGESPTGTEGESALDSEDQWTGRLAGAGRETAIRGEENAIMTKMALINGLNGVAVGLTSPLLVYWFNLRFGVGPGALGPVFALTFFLTGVSSIWTGRLTERIGIVRTVVMVRTAAVVLLVLVPMMPTFASAAGLHVLRSALGRGSVGARRALAVNLVRSHRRGLASSVNNISMALPMAVGPSVAGVLLESGHLSVPFFAAAVLQFFYGTLYGSTFRRYEDGNFGGGAPPGAPPRIRRMLFQRQRRG